MSSVSADDFKNVMNITINATDAEYVLDAAIDLLNIFDCQISNMAGGPPKTVTLTSKQRGGVFAVARVVYFDYYKGVEQISAGDTGVAKSQLMANPTIMNFVEKIAQRLQGDDDARIPFVVATDTSGLE